MDTTTARNLVAFKAEDPNQTQFTQAQYNTALDLAQNQFSIDARSIIEEVSVTLTSGTQEYAVPSDFLVALLFRHNGIKLAPTTKYELSFQNSQDWTTLPNGTPVAVYMDEQNGKYGLVPAPDTTAASKTFLLDYIAVPSPTIAGGAANLLNGVTILQYYAPAIVAWAARELLSYIPQTDVVVMKRKILMEEYERYKDQAITTYNNMVDEPIRMQGGQIWQDNILKPKDNAFTTG